MKEYPSILGPSKAPHLPCIAFEKKYDGSNIRAEWSRKRSWWKFGKRHGLVDGTDDMGLGQAIEIWKRKYAEPMERIILDSKIYRNAESVTAFAEFFGPNSFAGQHNPSDEKDLILFDVSVHKKGILGPREFLDSFGFLGVARVVHEGILNDTFIDDVRSGKYGVNEGVVAKGGSGHKLWMRKIKTLKYMERLKAAYGEDWKKRWE